MRSFCYNFAVVFLFFFKLLHLIASARFQGGKEKTWIAMLKARTILSRLVGCQRRALFMNTTAAYMKEPHMNDFHFPYPNAEAWADGYRRRQKRNNFVLGVGLVLFGITAFSTYLTIILPALPPTHDEAAVLKN
ncbi:uncharacterized protein LOC118197223 [Stegodyphus dumicola]|uniref:uncharacterized protein LOC118197223 n=1 Tax=Stegodyphus dumicola TaxID=202533 RepID=UPI0015AB588B|nr:uncharacterized protein LOC118197223 [Stegodyphus dumicola]